MDPLLAQLRSTRKTIVRVKALPVLRENRKGTKATDRGSAADMGWQNASPFFVVRQKHAA
jgi:hypothetical protein